MKNEILMSLIAQRIRVFNLMTPANAGTEEGEALWNQYIILSIAINKLEDSLE